MLLREFRAGAVRTIVEFGAGRSSVRLAHEFPEAEIDSVEHDQVYYEKTSRLLGRYGLSSRVQLHLRPLTWQRHAGALYFSYEPGRFPADIDAVIIDGPPCWTRRGREACLYQVLDQLRVGGCVYLDDLSRSGEQKIVRNWQEAVGQAFSFRPLKVGHGWCVLQKEKPLNCPTWNLTVSLDSLEQNLRWIYAGVRERITRRPSPEQDHRS